MKISTWNVNSLNVRLPHVIAWLKANPVDALGLQELKLSDDKFPHEALNDIGYSALNFGQKTYNGVALLLRSPLSANDVVRNIPGFADPQARVIAATLQTSTGPLRLINAYFVNGESPGSEKFNYKMRWLDALHDWLQDEVQKHPRLALMGDFNIVPEDRDSYDPEGLAGSILHTAQERKHFQDLLDLGLSDAFRLFEQADKSYSWWDYRRLAFQRNRGLRIDHILISPPLVPQAQACHIDRDTRKQERPSDHAPVTLELSLT